MLNNKMTFEMQTLQGEDMQGQTHTQERVTISAMSLGASLMEEGEREIERDRKRERELLLLQLAHRLGM